MSNNNFYRVSEETPRHDKQTLDPISELKQSSGLIAKYRKPQAHQVTQIIKIRYTALSDISQTDFYFERLRRTKEHFLIVQMWASKSDPAVERL